MLRTSWFLTECVPCRRPETEASLRAVFGLNDIYVKEKLEVDPEEFQRAMQEAVSSGMEESEELAQQLNQSLAVNPALL